MKASLRFVARFNRLIVDVLSCFDRVTCKVDLSTIRRLPHSYE
jgi:hypothetical protein